VLGDVIGHVAFEEKAPIFTTPRAQTNQPVNTKFVRFDHLVYIINLANFGYDWMQGIVWAMNGVKYTTF
jgi:hypothetical protein